jgi:hypothetical protein
LPAVILFAFGCSVFLVATAGLSFASAGCDFLWKR